MVSIKLKILEKGSIVKEQLLRLLQKHEDRITALEQGVDPDGVTVSDIKDADTVEAVITYVDESTATVNLVIQVEEEATDESP